MGGMVDESNFLGATAYVGSLSLLPVHGHSTLPFSSPSQLMLDNARRLTRRQFGPQRRQLFLEPGVAWKQRGSEGLWGFAGGAQERPSSGRRPRSRRFCTR